MRFRNRCHLSNCRFNPETMHVLGPSKGHRARSLDPPTTEIHYENGRWFQATIRTKHFGRGAPTDGKHMFLVTVADGQTAASWEEVGD